MSDMEMRARHAEGQLSPETKYALLANGLSTRKTARGIGFWPSFCAAAFIVGVIVWLVVA